MRLRVIFILILAFLLGRQGDVLYAQVKGSPANNVNAIDYRYQHYDRTLPKFADSLKFRDKVYNQFGFSFVSDWERGASASSLTGWNARIATGYRFTPVHATELDLLVGEGGNGLTLGADLNYVMNLNNYAYKREMKHKFESMFIAGLSYRYDKYHAYGLNTGLRLQWNFWVNAGLYVEPKVNLLTSVDQQRLLITQPSISVGLAIRYSKQHYTLWNCLSDFFGEVGNLAIKTNLLYDAAAIPNIGFEVHLGRNYSISANWMYAWWNKDQIGWYWRVYGGELAFRKWFGKKAKERLFTGHHLGVYGQCFTYDFAIKGKGQIGGDSKSTLWDKPNYAVGIEYGYSIPIAKRLNLDFCAGFGYMGGEYKEYQYMDNCYVWQVTKGRHWIGPTKAEVSLVWLIGKTADKKD